MKVYEFMMILASGIVCDPVAPAFREWEYPINNCLADEIDLLFLEDTSLPFEAHPLKIFHASSQNVKIECFLEAFTTEGLTSEVDRIRLAHATFSDNVTLHLTFNNTYKDITGMARSTGKFRDKLFHGGANTGEALRFILEEAFTPEMGSRPTAQHIVILQLKNLPTVNLDLAREMTERLEQQSDIRVITYHNIKNLEANSSLVPTTKSVKVDKIWYFNCTFVRDLCQKCEHGHIAVHEADGFTCYMLIKSSRPLNYHWAYSTCTSPRGYIMDTQLVAMETEDELISAEWALRDYASRNLIGHSNLTFFTHMRRRQDTLDGRFGWPDGRHLVYNKWLNAQPGTDFNEVCVSLTLTNLNPTSPDGQNGTKTNVSRENQMAVESSGFIIEDCDNTHSFIVCENKVKFGHENRSREMSSSVPSMDNIKNALASGHYVLVDQREDSTGNIAIGDQSFVGKVKLMSLSSVLQIMMSGDSPPTYGNLTDKFEEITQETVKHAVLFDCEAAFTTELLTYNRVCDRRVDCSTGRDETICGDKGYRGCTDYWEKICTSGQCIPRKGWCDLYPDCLDGSDELHCRDTCNHHLTLSGRCILESTVSYELPGSDVAMEKNRYEFFGECVAECNRTKCLTRDMILDDNGTVYCHGPEGRFDVTLRHLEGSYCYTENGSTQGREYTWAPRCVYIKSIYDTIIGCADFQNLRHCENFTCPEGYFKCPQSYCIPLHYLRNQEQDCPYGFDEDVEHITENNNFECSTKEDNPPILLHPSLVCDGYDHCPRGDDELDCNVTCREGFMCFGGAVVVTDYNKSETLEDLSFIDARTKYLDLSGVPLFDFFRRYPTNHFMNVLWLNMSNCQLESLELKNSAVYHPTYGWIFDGRLRYSGVPHYKTPDFSTVMTLDVSHNHLTSLGIHNFTAWFLDGIEEFNALGAMINLQHLNLSHNPELVISKIGFTKVAGHLVSLDVSFTPISQLSKDIMDMFSSLTTLRLVGTKITHVKSVFPTTLQVLDLRSIPLEDIEPNVFDGLNRMQQLSASSFKLCCHQVRGSGVPEYACFAAGDVVSSCDDLIQEPILRILLWLFGSAALLGNIIVVIYRVTWDRAVLRRGYGIFVINLSLSDLLMGVYMMMVALADFQYRGEYIWYDEVWRESWMCHVAGFLSTWSCESSAMFIFLITLDRYLVIRYPFGQVRFSMTGFIVASAFAWLVGLVLAVLPLLPQFRHWFIYSSNGMCLGLPLTTDKAAGWEYSTFIFVGVNFVLFVLIACGQIAIYRTMSSSRIGADEAMSNFQTMRRQQDIAVAKQLSLVVISDFLCWFPIGAMGMLAISGNDLGTDVYAWTAVLVLPVNSAINPVLYTVPALKKAIEEAVIKLWEKITLGSRSDMKKEDSINSSGDSTNYNGMVTSLVSTLKSAKEFLQKETTNKAQLSTLCSQASILNKELEEVKNILKEKTG